MAAIAAPPRPTDRFGAVVSTVADARRRARRRERWRSLVQCIDRCIDACERQHLDGATVPSAALRRGAAAALAEVVAVATLDDHTPGAGPDRIADLMDRLWSAQDAALDRLIPDRRSLPGDITCDGDEEDGR